MKKKYFLIAILFLFFFGILFSIQMDYSTKWKNKKIEYKLSQNSELYLYHNGERVSFYTVRGGSVVYCESITIDGVSRLCYLEIDKNSDPLIGWIRTEFLFEKGGL